MKDAILETLSKFQKIIISPDIDGFMSAELLSRKFDSVVVGTYDKNLLCLADDVKPEECLFLDCDMNTKDFVSVGNHMRIENDNMADSSFNPNRFWNTKMYTSKFPYATCFLISSAIEVDLDLYDLKRMAHADSTLTNMDNYSANMLRWSSRLREVDIKPIIEKTLDISDIRAKYPTQSFVSRRFGLDRYLVTLNAALISEGIKHLPITTGKRYMADKVGINTLMRYMNDIISYAEIYSGEYSVTYNQEMEWR
jgi:hypothetical protein